ncbi:ribonucleoside-diphosphate reductase subunit alpha [Flavobacteriaceae bacterium]|nr:ribonucleoside-diphosphate reductase subunit alpha [Flavobacteriaceae bacterium]
MKVKKRDGSLEEMRYDKITRRISSLCSDLNLDYVDPTYITLKVTQGIYDGISSTELDTLAAETAASMTTTHPDYAKLAGRLAVTNLHKTTPKKFSQSIKELYSFIEPRTGTESSLISDELFDFVKKNRAVIDGAIVQERDFDFDFFGFKTLERSYLLKIGERIVERPQYLYMRVAMGICDGDIEMGLRIYDDLSQHFYTHATPTLFNAGTRRPQMSSCFLIGNKGDDINGLFDTIQDVANISKWAGGIGLHVHDVRAKGSYIKGTGGESDGLLPMMKTYNEVARWINQGGKRKGSFAVYLEPWHADVFEFIDLRKNHGKEEMRARDLFLAMWTPDLFMQRVQEDGDWTLFSPDEAPGLSDVYDSPDNKNFTELYEKYESEGKGRRVLKARKLMDAILTAQIETGTPYMLYKDPANYKSNQQNLGTIKSSNLCTEIIEYSSPEEQAVCNLASIALPKYIIDGEFSHKLLYEYVYQVVKNLNNVINLNFYPTKETEKSNMRHRPVGLGVQGLADVFCMLKIPFESEEGDILQTDIFETLYFAAMTSSKDLAEVHGPYESISESPIEKGIFQYQMWGLKDEDLSGRWDWSSLRKQVIKFGVRNSLLVAPMPTASTAQILNNNEAFEPFTTNLYSRRTLGGEFIVINKHLVNELMSVGLWGDEIKDKLIMENGSVQNIPEIPTEIKEVFKTVWEMSQKRLLNMAANRSVFIDQSQSLNLFISNATKAKLLAAHLHGWKLGLKTGMYYLRTRSAVDPLKGLGVNTSKKKTPVVDVEPQKEVTENNPIPTSNSLLSENKELKMVTNQDIRPDDSPFDCEGCGS